MAADDDLNRPLGQKNRKSKLSKLPKLPFGAPQLLAGALGLFGLVAVGWAMFANDPLGGEPVAVVATGPITQGSDAAGDQSGNDNNGAVAGIPVVNPAGTAKATSPSPPPPGSRTVTIIDGSSGKRHEVVIPGNEGLHTSVDRQLLQMTPHGSIPRIARDDARALAH